MSTGHQPNDDDAPLLRTPEWAKSRTAQIAYVVVGTVGLVALAVAVAAPKGSPRRRYLPTRDAVEPQLEKLWADAKPLLDQLTQLLVSASPESRKGLIASLQNWAGRFTAW